MLQIYVTVCFNDSNSAVMSERQEELNFGHSGYVYLPSDPASRTLVFTKCQYYDVNVTICTFMNKTVKTTQEIILIRAWLAVTLRDNIATIFSYLLHLSNDIFSNEIYSSLYLLYHELQKNNIKIMDLIVRLKPIGNVNILYQLTMLFKSMHTTVPSYCRNALDNVSKIFFKKKDKLKNIFSNAKQDGIDLFADIPIELIPMLRWKNSGKNFSKLEAFHGKEYAILFSQIVEKKIRLTQPVLGVLLLNTRFNHLPPQAMEDLRYLADVLRYNKINWNYVWDDYITDPYDFIQKALVSMKEASGINQDLKKVISDFLKFSFKPLNTEEQPYYDKMKPFLTSASFNLPLFFDNLLEDVHIPDAQILKKLSDNKTKIASKGFISHYYDTPDKLRLAFLQRIKNRILISKSDQQSLTNVINFLERKYDFQMKGNGISARIKRQPFLYPNQIFDKTVTIYGKLNEMNKSLKSNESSYENTCSKFIFESSSPLWLQNLNKSADAESALQIIQNASRILMNFLNETKNLKIVQTVQNSSKLEEKKFEHQTLDANQTNIFSRGFFTSDKTIKNYLIQILKTMLNIKEVRVRPIVFYEVLRLYCILVHGPNNHSHFDFDDTESQISGNLIGNNSFIVSKILNDKEFIKDLSSILFEEYDTKQLFLVALFKKMLTLEIVKQDSDLFNEVTRLLRTIIPLPIDLSDLTNAIVVESLDDAQSVQMINQFLSARDTIINLGDDFDVGHYRTKGSLLYTILWKSLNGRIEENGILNTIKKILLKIDCSTIGAEKVRGIEETFEIVDFKKLIKYGLERQNMSSQVVGAFFNMTTWQSVFDPLKIVNEMKASLYDTRADFINGFLEILFKNIEDKTSEMKKDIELMKTAVKKTGSGLEPVDYIFK